VAPRPEIEKNVTKGRSVPDREVLYDPEDSTTWWCSRQLGTYRIESKSANGEWAKSFHR
jgi:hypothetical protein